MMDGAQGNFLATTALEAFWLKDREITFLGPWCLRYSQKEKWNSWSYRVLAYPWQNRHLLHEAGEYCDNLYEGLLALISECLNELHRESHNVRYWRIIIGPWLSNYIQVLYERYTCLKSAFEKYPNFKTICLAEKSYVVPKDYHHFMSLVATDGYNLQLYSQLLRLWGYSFASKYLADKDLFPMPKDKTHSKSISRKQANKIWVYLDMLYSRHAAVLLAHMYFPFLSDVWRLCHKSKFSAWPVCRMNIDEIELGPEPMLRERLIKKLTLESKPRDEFSVFLIKSLFWNLPLTYLEGYAYLSAFVAKIYGKSRPKAIFSAIGWHFCELFKILAARKIEQGAKLIGIQHGGTFGLKLKPFAEKHELAVCNLFYSWGWKNPYNVKVKVLPNPVVCTFKRPKKHRRTILYTGTAFPRYLYRITSAPVGPYFVEYLEWRERFLRLLVKDCFKQLSIRLYSEDYGWDQKKRLIDNSLKIKFDDHKKRFFERLSESKLVIVDNPQTVWLQVLASNVPAILFWNPKLWELRDRCISYINKLQQAGILFYSPEEAARKVQEVHNAPEAWWGCKEVQEARSDFIKEFVEIRSDWLNVWAHELRTARERENPNS